MPTELMDFFCGCGVGCFCAMIVIGIAIIRARNECTNVAFHVNVDEGIECMGHEACVECRGKRWKR